jgi:hypothetical protein
MVQKINNVVCDICRICCSIGVDGYAIENGWRYIYNKDGSTTHHCPKCALGQNKDTK